MLRRPTPVRRTAETGIVSRSGRGRRRLDPAGTLGEGARGKLDQEQSVLHLEGIGRQALSGLGRRAADRLALGSEDAVVAGTEEAVVVRFPIHLAAEMGTDAR